MVLVNLSLGTASASPSANTNSSSAPVNIVVPGYASWFSLEDVHEIEKRALPEFFPPITDGDLNPSKNGQVYKEFRNFMINTYRARPKEYLSLTICRRYLSGDVGAIVRIHAFLEQWGLINLQVEAAGAVSTALSSATSTSLSTQVELPKLMSLQTVAATQNDPSVPSKPTTIVACFSCKAECSQLYFVANSSSASGSSAPPLVVCSECWGEGRYPMEFTLADFVKVQMSAAQGSSGSEWSETESSDLLNALEEQRDAEYIDWTLVSVRTGRPKEQCLAHFLSLPILDGLRQEDGKTETGFSDQLPIRSFPLGSVENPVMSCVAFLASTVHPQVAAAAANAAIGEIVKRRKIENVDSNLKNDLPADYQKSTFTFTQSMKKEHLEAIAATSLGCAAARAAVLAEQQEKQIERSRDALVELHLQKVRLKLAFFEQLERSLEDEKRDLEQQRLQLFMERFNLRKMMMSMGKTTNCILKDEKVVPVPTNEHSPNDFVPVLTSL